MKEHVFAVTDHVTEETFLCEGDTPDEAQRVAVAHLIKAGHNADTINTSICAGTVTITPVVGTATCKPFAGSLPESLL
jgi:uncharacterized protein YerC